MLNTRGMKLEPFLRLVALVVCQNPQVSEVNDNCIGMEEGDRFFYLGAGFWRCIVRRKEIGWDVMLVNPGVSTPRVAEVQKAAEVILSPTKP